MKNLLLIGMLVLAGCATKPVKKEKNGEEVWICNIKDKDKANIKLAGDYTNVLTATKDAIVIRERLLKENIVSENSWIECTSPIQ